MGSYRNRLDIIADILNAASQGAKKTQVMYKANLSYRLLTKYLTEVTQLGFVHFEVSQKRYLLTQRGKEFLARYKEYSRHNKRFEKQLNNVHDKRKVLEKLCTNM